MWDGALIYSIDWNGFGYNVVNLISPVRGWINNKSVNIAKQSHTSYSTGRIRQFRNVDFAHGITIKMCNQVFMHMK